MENSNEKNGCKCISKPLAIIAIVLSVVSIIFSSFTLISAKGRPRRDFHMQRPYNIQSEMKGGYPNGNRHQFNGKNFDKPNNSNNNNSNQPNNNGPTTAPSVSP